MNKLLFFIAVFAFFSFSAPAQDISGSYTGNIHQENYDGTYTVCINIKRLELGKVSGTIYYQELSCGGALVSYGPVKHKDGRTGYVFKEKISVGENRCANNGTVTLLWNEQSQSYTFYWMSEAYPNSSCEAMVYGTTDNCKQVDTGL